MGGTLCNAADALIAHGAKDVLAYITYGVLSRGGLDRVFKSRLRELLVSDTSAPTEEQKSAASICTLPIAPPIGEAIAHTAKEEGVSSSFN